VLLISNRDVRFKEKAGLAFSTTSSQKEFGEKVRHSRFAESPLGLQSASQWEPKGSVR